MTYCGVGQASKRLCVTCLRVLGLLLLVPLGSGCAPIDGPLRQDSITCGGLVLVLIPEGKRWIGTYSSNAYNRETPMGEIAVDYVIYLSTTEVPRDVFEMVLGSDHAGSVDVVAGEEDYPAVVPRGDAERFCKAFSRIMERGTGRRWNVRLPMETEWEYAARYGRPFHEDWWPRTGGGPSDGFSLAEYAWYKYNADGTMHPIAQKKPNVLGLYDMFGNAEEWCSGSLTSSVTEMVRQCIVRSSGGLWGGDVGGLYPVRGGDYSSDQDGCRPSARGSTCTAGFRVVAVPAK